MVYSVLYYWFTDWCLEVLSMTVKRFVVEKYSVRDMSIDEKYVNSSYHIGDKGIAQSLCDLLNELTKENEQLKSQLYCNDKEGVCNICKHHYLVKDDDIELGYYNSRCKKGHYECARVSLKYCEDFEKER